MSASMRYAPQQDYMPLRHHGNPSYSDMRSDSYTKEASGGGYGGMSDRDLVNRAYGGGYDDAPRRGGAGSSRKKLWWTLGIVALLAIIGGVVAGVLVAKNNSKSSSGSGSNASQGSNSGSSSGGSSSGGSSTGGTGDANFDLDPRLKKSFYAMAYTTPNSANYPTCGDKPADIVKDIQLLSQLTTRLRLYGADCNQSALVLDAIQRTQVNMTVWLGVYMDTDPTVYQRQIATTIDVLKQYGTDHVSGIIVGNEYILGQYTNSPANQAAAQALVLSNVADTRRQISALNLPKTIPIGSGDAGSMVTAAYAAGVDFLFSNNHPFFSGVTIDQAAAWTDNYIKTDTPSVAFTAANKPTVWQGEVGWPYGAIAGGSLSLNGSAASPQNMQRMLDSKSAYLCTANAESSTIPYVWFEAFDERWKLDLYKGSEAFWGLFDFDKNFKSSITIPDCAAP